MPAPVMIIDLSYKLDLPVTTLQYAGRKEDPKYPSQPCRKSIQAEPPGIYNTFRSRCACHHNICVQSGTGPWEMLAPGRYVAMKIMGICGSPRNGNTEWMLERVLEAARNAGAETELILLKDKDIKLCRGCLSCEVEDETTAGVCVIKDEMEPLLSKMLAADGFVFGTPVYFYMLSGLMKNFMDRTIPIWPLLKNKTAAGVAVAEDAAGKALDNLRTYADVCNLEWIGDVSAFAKDPGDLAGNEGIAAALGGLGRRLVGGTEQ